MLLLSVPLVAVGCGVAQGQYDVVVAELNQASKELQAVRSELVTAQATVSELTSSLEKTQASLKVAEANNSELTSSLEKAESELKAGSTELTASLQKSQAELEAAQDKVSELTSNLKTVENELETIKSKYKAFKSEVESLLVLSLNQQLALERASRDAQSASFDRDYKDFVNAVGRVKDKLADLIDVKADKLTSLWKDAYYMETHIHHNNWGLHPGEFMDFTRLNSERILAIKIVLSKY
jgi:chromosome segregation ATPase